MASELQIEAASLRPEAVTKPQTEAASLQNEAVTKLHTQAVRNPQQQGAHHSPKPKAEPVRRTGSEREATEPHMGPYEEGKNHPNNRVEDGGLATSSTTTMGQDFQEQVPIIELARAAP